MKGGSQLAFHNLKLYSLIFLFFLVTSLSSSINTTIEGIDFECSKFNTSLKYFNYVYEKDKPQPPLASPCEKNGCRCKADKLQANTAYLVSLMVCKISQCKTGPYTRILYTKPEGNLIICAIVEIKHIGIG